MVRGFCFLRAHKLEKKFKNSNNSKVKVNKWLVASWLVGSRPCLFFLFQTMCWLKFPKSQKLQICRMLLAMLQVWSITHSFFLMLFQQIDRDFALSLPQSRVVLSAILWMETIPRGLFRIHSRYARLWPFDPLPTPLWIKLSLTHLIWKSSFSNWRIMWYYLHMSYPC